MATSMTPPTPPTPPTVQPPLKKLVSSGHQSVTITGEHKRLGYAELHEGTWDQKFSKDPNTSYDGSFRHASSNASPPGSYADGGLRDCSVDEWIYVVILQPSAEIGDVIDAWAYAYQ